MTTEQIRRLYNCADNEMRDAAHTFVSQFPNHEEGFRALDPEIFHPEFHVEFTQTLAVAGSVPSDNVLIDEVASETSDTDAKRIDCVNAVSGFKYFAKKAAKGNKHFMNKFGYNDLDSCRNSTKKMILFMQDFVSTMNKNRDALLEAKMPEEKFGYFESLASELVNEREGQKDAKYRRADATDQRIQYLNTVWRIMVVIADAVQYAFPKGHIAQDIFTLPRPKQKSESE